MAFTKYIKGLSFTASKKYDNYKKLCLRKQHSIDKGPSLVGLEVLAAEQDIKTWLISEKHISIILYNIFNYLPNWLDNFSFFKDFQL